MSLKEILDKEFKDKDLVLDNRYRSSKFVFVFCSTLFFSNYLFVGAKFYESIFLSTLIYSYVLFLVSFFVFIMLYIKQNTKIPKIAGYFLISVFAIFLLVSLLPFIK